MFALAPKAARKMAFPFNHAEVTMGLLDEVGKIAGAVAAVEAAEKVDPDAGLLTKAVAAVAGFKGAGALEAMLEKKDEAKAEGAGAAPEDGAAPQA